jgi:hypothetical protein
MKKLSLWRLCIAACIALMLGIPAYAADLDGVYNTTKIDVRALGRGACTPPKNPVLRITKGDASMYWRDLMKGKIGGDGSVDISTPNNSLKGQIANGVFTGVLQTSFCVYQVTLARG